MSDEQKKVRKRIILLNGPPGCGKDTAAWAILGYVSRKANYIWGSHEKFAEPLKKGVHHLFGLFEGWDSFDDPKQAHLKNQPHRDLFGMTPREAYIWMSEVCVKPLLGNDAFGKLMEHRLRRKPKHELHVISDCGFAEEVIPVIDYVGEENVLILEIHATGKTFDGDSRSYISEAVKAQRPNVQCRKVYNDIGDATDREIYKRMCQGAAKKFLNLNIDDDE